jgi:porin
VNVFVTPQPWLYAGIGVYDASTSEGLNTGSRGPGTFGHHGLFCIAEGGIKWTQMLPGRAAAGAWHNSTSLERFDGSSESGTTGFYLTLDQALWRARPEDKEDSRGLAAFGQYGWADSKVSAFEHHVGGGLTWTGLIPGRDDDVLGTAITYVRLSDAPGAGFDRRDEVVGELFYKVQVLKWLSVKPDVQGIHHPGGSGGVHDAVVASLRVQADF